MSRCTLPSPWLQMVGGLFGRVKILRQWNLAKQCMRISLSDLLIMSWKRHCCRVLEGRKQCLRLTSPKLNNSKQSRWVNTSTAKRKNKCFRFGGELCHEAVVFVHSQSPHFEPLVLCWWHVCELTRCNVNKKKKDLEVLLEFFVCLF